MWFLSKLNCRLKQRHESYVNVLKESDLICIIQPEYFMNALAAYLYIP